MVMRTMGARRTAEAVSDLADWARQLPDCPPITHTTVGVCRDASHGDEPADWFYVEADPLEGLCRLRCLSGGHVKNLLDSAERWTFPGVWACRNCNQSIAEVVYGVHDEDGVATWLAVLVRCVECGDVAGVTDMVLPPTELGDLLASL